MNNWIITYQIRYLISLLCEDQEVEQIPTFVLRLPFR